MFFLIFFYDFWICVFYVFLMAFLGLMCSKCKNFVKKSISYIYILYKFYENVMKKMKIL
jgi:hypothetical protein